MKKQRKEEIELLKEVIINQIKEELKPENKEMRETIERVCNRIIKMPQTTPVQHFRYGEAISMIDFVKWFEYTQLYYSIGRKFIEQEEGSCCCVDKAFNRYLIPECNKAYGLIFQAGTLAEQKRILEIINWLRAEVNSKFSTIMSTADFNILQDKMDLLGNLKSKIQEKEGEK